MQIFLSIKCPPIICKIGETSRGGRAWMWRGAHLPLSHTHTPSQIFQNTLCIICWHKQSSQSLVCPWSICDNASVGSCSLCFLGSPVVLELSEGRKYALMSQVLSNTSVKVFFGTKTSLRPPNFFFWGQGGYVPLAPPTPPSMTSWLFWRQQKTIKIKLFMLPGLFYNTLSFLDFQGLLWDLKSP